MCGSCSCKNTYQVETAILALARGNEVEAAVITLTKTYMKWKLRYQYCQNRKRSIQYVAVRMRLRCCYVETVVLTLAKVDNSPYRMLLG